MLSALAFTLSATARGEDEIKGPQSIPVYELGTYTTDVEADGYLWLVDPFETSSEAHQKDPKVYQFTGHPGRHVITLVPFKAGIPIGKFRRVVVIGSPDPTPPPVPPGPQPPPGPGPGPQPPPSPVGGFRALIVAETSANMTRGQLAALNAAEVVGYLNRKCIKESDGRAGWRRFDPDVDISAEPVPLWRQLWADTKPTLGQLPVIVLFDGTKGTVHPLPDSVPAMLALLATYGG
jgi:hypothetical protein